MKTVSRATPISKSSTRDSSSPPASAPARRSRPPSGPLVRGRSGFRFFLLALLVLGGASGNLIRALSWTQASGFIAAPFGSTAAAPATSVVERYARIELPAPAWRPIRVEFQARAASGAEATGQGQPERALGGERTTLEASVDGEDLPGQTIGAAWQALSLSGSRAAVADGLVTLRLSTLAAGTREAGGRVELTGIRVTPRFAVAPLVWHGGAGALFGLLVWGLLVWRGPAAREADEPESEPIARAGLVAGLAIFALLATWALIKPPLQSPDEPHQFLRVTSLLNGPWVGGASTLTLDPRFFNPTVWGSPRLAAITFDTTRPLTREDVVALKAVPWPAPPAPTAPASTVYVAITSYPPLYYWGVFAIGQPIAAVAQLTPYQAFFLFRLASVLLVTLAWTAVYILLRRTPETAPHAEAILAVLLLNPMLAFMSSAVTADALSFPLITLAVLACWRTLTTGTGVWTMFAAALLALWTKPSGAQMVGALTLAIGWGVWRAWALPGRAWPPLRALWLAGAIAYAGFYAWSPAQFTFEPGHATIGLQEYVTHLLRALPDVWISFWGHLGWLEYRLAWPWYAALFALVLVCALLHLRGRRRVPAFTQFLLVYALAFIGSTIVGGFINLKVAGYMLQGRYFLPVAIALAPLVMHEQRGQRWLLPSAVGVVHLLLAWATIARYYSGDLGLLWASMPFV